MRGLWRSGSSIASSPKAPGSRLCMVARNELERYDDQAVLVVSVARGLRSNSPKLFRSNRSRCLISAINRAAITSAFKPTSPLLCSRRPLEMPSGSSESVALPTAQPSQPSSVSLDTSPASKQTAELLRSIARRGGGALRRSRHGTPASTEAALSDLLKPNSVLARGEAVGQKVGASPLAAASVKRGKRIAGSSPLLTVFDVTAPQLFSSSPPKTEPNSLSPSTGDTAQKRCHVSAPRMKGRANSGEGPPNSSSRVAGRALSSAPSPAPRPTPPSRALLDRLLHTIQTEKRVSWDTLARQHLEVHQMPLFACRREWCEFLSSRGSATPIHSSPKADSGPVSSSPFPSYAAVATSEANLCATHIDDQRRLPPLLLCAASTGTGKSVLIPLYALDTHWALLERRLRHTIDVYDEVTSISGEAREAGAAHKPARPAFTTHAAEANAAQTSCDPFPLDSHEKFSQEFTACSRLRIVVSQPTRVACAELAAYVSTLLGSGRTCDSSGKTTAAMPDGADGSSGGGRSDNWGRLRSRQLVGKRVGFAVGGESCFCRETEIVFATPGYILNAVQLSHPRSPSSLSLSPTTLVVDEAHCRDLETDALLTWMKLSRERERETDVPAPNTSPPLAVLRQYFVVSATMNLRAMDAYLCRGLKREDRSDGLAGEHGPAPNPVPADAPALLLSAMQRRRVRRWWIREQAAHIREGVDDAEIDLAVMRALGTDPRVRAAVLQLVESTEGEDECDEGDRGDPRFISDAANVANILFTGSPLGSKALGLPASGYTALTAAAAAAATAATATAPPPPRARAPPSQSPLELYSANGAAIVISKKPYRVERYFVDDLDPVNGCFRQSCVLFDDVTRRNAAASAATAAARSPSGALLGAANGTDNSGRSPKQHGTAAPSPSAGSGDQWSSRGLPICLTDDGAALQTWLVDLYGTRAASYAMLSSHARAIVELLLQLLQAARYRWIDGASVSRSAASTVMPPSPNCEQGYREGNHASPLTRTTIDAGDLPASKAPVTVLVFVAGIGELHQIMLALERRCDIVQPSPSIGWSQSHSTVDSGASSTPVLRHGGEVFSVGLLHSSAVGSPQEQLMVTEHSGAPLRLLLSTNVAESSLTISNTRIVVDTCLERRVNSDDITGAARVLTSFVSPSGLRQRCGRVGRTCDGIVIHLAPRRFVLPEVPLQLSSTTTTPTQATPTLEPLPDGVAAVLLRLKFLFPKVSAALAALPSPPGDGAASLALQQLADADLFLLPEVPRAFLPHGMVDDLCTGAACTVAGQHSLMESRAAVASVTAGDPSRTEDAAAHHTRDGVLLALLDTSFLTPKGRLVASLPLPYEHAILVYHGLQFCCVEDAVMVACATAVPSLFLTPRVSPRSAIRVGARSSTKSDYVYQRRDVDNKAALSPLEQYYRHLWVQRHLAGFTPRLEAAATSAERRGGQLSEPLMLRALLRQWYTFSSADDCTNFQHVCGLNRGAMRQVDFMVAQTCGRLIRLLLQLNSASAEAPDAQLGGADQSFVLEDNEAEVDISAYVCHANAVDLCTSVKKGDTEGNHIPLDTIPFLYEWSAETRAELLRSLRRLQRAAIGRLRLRHAELRQRYGLPQWYNNDERWIRLWSRPYIRSSSTDSCSSGAGRRGTSDVRHGPRAKEGETVEAVRRHPCFTYWARGLPALPSPYPSLYRQQHPVPSSAASAVAPLTSNFPPPVSMRVTRSRAPIYRAPSPPPPFPHVVFVMGHTDDRLCAAFVAAFGHRTLRGEDGGHRFHHRRLLRNMQILGNDEEHVCTFNIDVQQQQQQQDVVPSRLSPPPSSSDLRRTSGVTLESVERALAPYLRGTGLQQLEIFMSNRLAMAARFARDGFSGLLNSFMPSSPNAFRINVGADNSADDGVDGAVSVKDMHPASVECGGAAGSVIFPQPVAPAVTASETAPTSTDDAHTPPEDLLKAVVLPPPLRHVEGGRSLSSAIRPANNSSSRRSHPHVQLAPFGVSLLTAATAGTGGRGGGSGLGGLQRIPLMDAATDAPRSPTQSTHPLPFSATTVSLPATVSTRQDRSAMEERRGVRFSEVSAPHTAAAAPSSGCSSCPMTEATTTCITWPDSLGICSRSITRAAVEALGLSDLFPTASLRSSNASPLGSREARELINDGSGSPAAPEPSVVVAAKKFSDGSGTPATLTFSILPPIYATRSITWKVPLPTCILRAGSVAQAKNDGGTDAAWLPAHYCTLCNRIYANQGALHQHYRSTSHLDHLYHAVLLGMRREHLEMLYGWTPGAASGRPCVDTTEAPNRGHPGSTETEGNGSTPRTTLSGTASLPLASLLCVHSATQLSFIQHVFPCTIGSQSFLNCLQWLGSDSSPSSLDGLSATSAYKAGGRAVGGAGRATPLAVAGTLVSMQSTADILPPPHLRQSSTSATMAWGEAGAGPLSSSVDADTLAAHHVWVLDISHNDEVRPTASATTPPPLSALLAVAGYLAAASPQAMVATLLNATHTHLHAIMLYGLGVWRLPTPLPMEGYMGLLEHITRGGGWPGVLTPVPDDHRDRQRRQSLEPPSSVLPGPSDGLHWCLPEASCAAAATEEHCCHASAGRRTMESDSVVEATLLLVLHEYQQAGRNMVVLADYVERVMHKLHISPFLAAVARATRGIEQSPQAATAAEVLTAYLSRERQGQTIQALLRDLGCIFATPPRALAALMQPARASTGMRDVEGSCIDTQGGPHEGGSREASVSPDAVLSKRLSLRALGAEGAVVEMMFTVPPALPSRLPPPLFAAQLRQFYVGCHAHRWAPLRQASEIQSRTVNNAVSSTHPGNKRLGRSKSQGNPSPSPQTGSAAHRPHKVTHANDRKSAPQF